MSSINPNGLATVMPGAGTSFAVKGSSEIFLGSVDATCLAANTLQLATVTLTPAQIKTLYSAPTQIIASPGAGKSIVVDSALARFTYTTPAYTSGGAVQLQYDNTVHAGGTAVLNTLPANIFTGTASVDTYDLPGASNITVTQNKGIFASCATANFATGTISTLTFFVWYRIV